MNINKETEEERVCEACGGEITDTLIGDECYDRCIDCGFVSH